MWLWFFLIGLIWLGYVYAGYPLILWFASFWRRFRPERNQDYLPNVSILISARNEEKDIEWKVRETLAFDYPADRLELIVASDASEDQTDEILRSIRDPRLKYIRFEKRVGKNEALNRLVQIATGDLLLFSDANSHIGTQCLRSMVSHFADPRVGSVTGTEHSQEDGMELAVGSGTRAYLDYEFMVSRLESRVGSVIVCDGSLFMIRRKLFHPLQPDLANDLELPIWIGSRGYKLLCDPAAWALEKPMRSPHEEFNRKRRICAQGVLGFWRLHRFLHGFRAWQFFSRKVLRWLSLIPLGLLLVSTIALAERPFFAVFLGLQAAFYALGLLGFLFALSRRKVNSLLTIPFYFLLVNLAAIVGVCEACAGRRFAVWEVAVLSRGQENA
jgi:cellulose synthase/poly-beta-1,6-N-acetylglucosamine synthase-like glycosyltransferase